MVMATLSPQGCNNQFSGMYRKSNDYVVRMVKFDYDSKTLIEY